MCSLDKTNWLPVIIIIAIDIVLIFAEQQGDNSSDRCSQILVSLLLDPCVSNPQIGLNMGGVILGKNYRQPIPKPLENYQNIYQNQQNLKLCQDCVFTFSVSFYTTSVRIKIFNALVEEKKAQKSVSQIKLLTLTINIWIG